MAGWATATIFVSSTFRDMQAERDWLVRFVFPRVRDRLRGRRVHLADVDLRWGITSEDNVLVACTDIISTCPYFLGILGGRYGHVPPGQELSITHCEIRHVLMSMDRAVHQCLFYRRRPAVTNLAVGSEREQYLERVGTRREEMLDELVREIEQAGHVVKEYSCRWDESAERFVDLDSFGETVYADLIASIDDTPRATDAQPLEEERAATQAFIASRVDRWVLGDRQPVLDSLREVSRGGSNDTASVACLVGESGVGKSALLAKFCDAVLAAEDDGSTPTSRIIPIFVGETPDSSDARRILRRLYGELNAPSIPGSFDALKDGFADALNAAVAGEVGIVLVVDGVERLEPTDNGSTLHWLPSSLPARVRLVLSVRPGPLLDVVDARWPTSRRFQLEAFDAAGAAEMCDLFLARHGKRFEPEQRAALLGKAEARRPLYLSLALEELRTIGSYDEISARIAELPDKTSDLFGWFLARLEHDWMFANVANSTSPSTSAFAVRR